MERIKYAYAQIFEYVYATWTCIKAWNFCAPNFKWGRQTSTAKCCMRHPKFVEAENPFIIWLLSVCGTLQPGINSRLGPKTDQHIQDEPTPRLCAYLPGPGPQRGGCTGRYPVPTRWSKGRGLPSNALLQ